MKVGKGTLIPMILILMALPLWSAKVEVVAKVHQFNGVDTIPEGLFAQESSDGRSQHVVLERLSELSEPGKNIPTLRSLHRRNRPPLPLSHSGGWERKLRTLAQQISHRAKEENTPFDLEFWQSPLHHWGGPVSLATYGGLYDVDRYGLGEPVTRNGIEIPGLLWGKQHWWVGFEKGNLPHAAHSKALILLSNTEALLGDQRLPLVDGHRFFHQRESLRLFRSPVVVDQQQDNTLAGPHLSELYLKSISTLGSHLSPDSGARLSAGWGLPFLHADEDWNNLYGPFVKRVGSHLAALSISDEWGGHDVSLLAELVASAAPRDRGAPLGLWSTEALEILPGTLHSDLYHLTLKDTLDRLAFTPDKCQWKVHPDHPGVLEALELLEPLQGLRLWTSRTPQAPLAVSSLQGHRLTTVIYHHGEDYLEVDLSFDLLGWPEPERTERRLYFRKKGQLKSQTLPPLEAQKTSGLLFHPGDFLRITVDFPRLPKKLPRRTTRQVHLPLQSATLNHEKPEWFRFHLESRDWHEAQLRVGLVEPLVSLDVEIEGLSGTLKHGVHGLADHPIVVPRESKHLFLGLKAPGLSPKVTCASLLLHRDLP